MSERIILTELEEAKIRNATATIREYYKDGIREKRWGQWFSIAIEIKEEDRHG